MSAQDTPGKGRFTSPYTGIHVCPQRSLNHDDHKEYQRHHDDRGDHENKESRTRPQEDQDCDKPLSAKCWRFGGIASTAKQPRGSRTVAKLLSRKCRRLSGQKKLSANFPKYYCDSKVHLLPTPGPRETASQPILRNNKTRAKTTFTVPQWEPSPANQSSLRPA